MILHGIEAPNIVHTNTLTENTADIQDIRAPSSCKDWPRRASAKNKWRRCKIIDAEKSDLFDVLAHVAYALPPITREERASKAKLGINSQSNSKQKVFLDFVLSHYVREGVGELDQEKLTPLLHLKYNDSNKDAVADLGRPEDIGLVFWGFQKYLYQPAA